MCSTIAQTQNELYYHYAENCLEVNLILYSLHPVEPVLLTGMKIIRKYHLSSVRLVE